MENNSFNIVNMNKRVMANASVYMSARIYIGVYFLLVMSRKL